MGWLWRIDSETVSTYMYGTEQTMSQKYLLGVHIGMACWPISGISSRDQQALLIIGTWNIAASADTCIAKHKDFAREADYSIITRALLSMLIITTFEFLPTNFNNWVEKSKRSCLESWSFHRSSRIGWGVEMGISLCSASGIMSGSVILAKFLKITEQPLSTFSQLGWTNPLLGIWQRVSGLFYPVTAGIRHTLDDPCASNRWWFFRSFWKL